MVDETLEHRQRLLSSVRLFDGLSDDELAALLPYFQRLEYPKGATFISEGDVGDLLYVIESGRVKVFLSDEDGKEVVLCEDQAGGVLGELSLLDGGVRSASVMTLERSSFLVLTRDRLTKFLEANPATAMNIISGYSKVIRRLSENVRSLVMKDVYERVVEKLQEISEEHGPTTRVVRQRITHQEIADRVGASRKQVSRVFTQLTESGYLSKEGRLVIIRDDTPRGW